MDKFKKQREELIDELKNQGIKDRNVLGAILKIPRHLFVPKDLIKQSYENYPLEVGKSQTISQPYTVAIMLEALELKKNDKVLEIGTASGWNACLIAEIIKPGIVYTAEIIPELVELAKENIKKIKLKNITVIHTDGSKGLSKYAPFDKIIITAGCPRIPDNLITQLKLNGIFVAPIGSLYSQDMLKIIKKKNGIEIKNLGKYIFVPLKGSGGWK
jgi:protein-L-isoaspartate(D-aspartate) O-methyltransferase